MNEKPRLSCERCRQRKLRCDKAVPCSTCKNAGLRCEIVQRARLPRGRSAKVRKEKSGGLETRVARIEELLESVKAQSIGGKENGIQSNVSRAADPSESLGKIDDFVAPEFWSRLSHEVAGLRETLESSDEDAPHNSETVDDISLSESLIFPCSIGEPSAYVPSSDRRGILLNLYRQRVDPIYKILHWPSVLESIQASYTETSSMSALALEYSICFIATCTLTDDEAEQMLLEKKSELLRFYRIETERHISAARLISRPNITVLQAFVIYLMLISTKWGLRTCMNCASTWTLVSLAIRVANNLRLGDEDPKAFSTFDLEMRRRLWYGIGVLDSFTALDRGMAPMILPSDLGPAPLNLNDEEISPPYVPKASEFKFTDMSYAILTHKAMVCHKKVCDVSKGLEGLEEWNRKLSLVYELEEFCQKRYLCIRDDAIPFERLTKMVAKKIITDLQLQLRRPPQKQNRYYVPSWDNFNVFEVATNILDQHSEQREDEFACWKWNPWVKWYVLAIVLAELCKSPTGHFADRAFKIAQGSFRHYSALVADSDTGMLWKPIMKLMRQVQLLRGGEPDDNDLYKQFDPYEQDSYSNKYTTSTECVQLGNQPVDFDSIPDAGDYSFGLIDSLDMTDLRENISYDMEIESVSWLDWDMFMQDFNSFDHSY